MIIFHNVLCEFFSYWGSFEVNIPGGSGSVKASQDLKLHENAPEFSNFLLSTDSHLQLLNLLLLLSQHHNQLQDLFKRRFWGQLHSLLL